MAKLKKKIKETAFLKLSRFQTFLLGFVILILIALVVGVVLTFAAGGPTITSIDGKAPNASGTVTDAISLTPTFSGKADPNTLVSIYQTPLGTVAPTLSAVAGDPQTLSATYQPAGASPGPFTDNFSNGINQNFWGTETLNGGNVNTHNQPPSLETSISSSGARAQIHTTDPESFDLSSVQGPIYAEINFTLNSASGTDYRNLFMIDSCVNNSPSCISVGFTINDQGISYSTPNSDGNSSNFGSLTTSLPTLNQRMKLRIEINSNNQAQFKVDTTESGTFDLVSPVINFNLWSGNSRLTIGNISDTNSNFIDATWDNLVTNFPLPGTPAGYLLSKTGMNYNGIDYQDPVPFIQGSPAGILAWGQQGPVTLDSPLPMPSPLQDIYVYATTLTVPAGAMGNSDPLTLHLTWYYLSPDQFSNIVSMINGQGMSFTVDAYALAYTASGSNLVPASLPVTSLGSVSVSTTTTSYTWPPYLNFVASGSSTASLDSGVNNPPQIVYNSSTGHYDADMVVLNYKGNTYSAVNDSGAVVYGNVISLYPQNKTFTVSANGTEIYDNSSGNNYQLDGTSNLSALLITEQVNGSPVHVDVLVQNENNNIQNLLSAFSQQQGTTVDAVLNNIYLKPANSTSNYTWNPAALNISSGAYAMSVSPLEFKNQSYDDTEYGKGIYTLDDTGYFHDWGVGQEPITPPSIFDGTKNINAYLIQIGTDNGQKNVTVYSVLNPSDFQNVLQSQTSGDKFRFGNNANMGYIQDYVLNIFTFGGAGQNYNFDSNATFNNDGSTPNAASTVTSTPVINPVTIPGTLIAKAMSDANGNWTASFGKDETGKIILNGNLSQFGSAPYKFFVQANGIPSAFVTAQSTSQDADGDGVPDSADHCPTIKGTGPRPTTYKLQINNFKSTASGITAPKVFVGTNQIQPDTAGGNIYTVKLSATDNDTLDFSNGNAKKLQAMKGAWVINRVGDKIVSGVWGYFTQNGYVSYSTKVTLDGSNNFYLTNGAEENNNRFESEGDGKSTVGDVNQDEYTVNGQVITSEATVKPSGDLFTIHVKDYDGCPYAINYDGRLQIQYSGMGRDKYADDDDQFDSNWIDLVPGPVGDTLKETVNQVNAKVFKQSDFTSDKNQGQISNDCDSIYDSTKAPVVTDQITYATQNIGVPVPDNYILAVRAQISDPSGDSRNTTVCRQVQKSQFDPTTGSTLDNVQVKAIYIMKKDTKGNNCKQFSPATQDIYSGSELSVTYPESVKWEEGIDTYVYPYIFSSDLSEDWDINVCTYVPTGYQVVGAYDENGNLVQTTDCTQTIVPNAEKVIAFQLIDTGSPSDFNINSTLSMVHKGKTQNGNISVHADKISLADLNKDNISPTYAQADWKQATSGPLPKVTPIKVPESTKGLLQKVKDLVNKLF